MTDRTLAASASFISCSRLRAACHELPEHNRVIGRIEANASCNVREMMM